MGCPKCWGRPAGRPAHAEFSASCNESSCSIFMKVSGVGRLETGIRRQAYFRQRASRPRLPLSSKPSVLVRQKFWPEARRRRRRRRLASYLCSVVVIHVTLGEGQLGRDRISSSPEVRVEVSTRCQSIDIARVPDCHFVHLLPTSPGSQIATTLDGARYLARLAVKVAVVMRLRRLDNRHRR